MKSASNILTAGLIGLGNIGLKLDLDPALSHTTTLTHARALASSPFFKTVFAVDLSSESRALFSSLYHTPAFSTLNHVPSELRHVDLVILALPPDLHSTFILEVLSLCTPQAILVEKPFGINRSDAVACNQLCGQHNTKLYVNYPRVSSPHLNKLKTQLNRQGCYTNGSFYFTKGLRNSGSHFISLAHHFFSEPCAYSVVQTTPAQDTFNIIYRTASLFFHHLKLHPLFTNQGILVSPDSHTILLDGCSQLLHYPYTVTSQYAFNLSADPESTPTVLDTIQLDVLRELHTALTLNHGQQLFTGDRAIEVETMLESLVLAGCSS